MRARRRRHDRRECGSATVELLGMTPLLFLCALAAWQILLGAWAVTSASNAARTGSRVEGTGGDGAKAAVESVSGPLRESTSAEIDGELARVVIEVPIVVPGLSAEGLTVTRTAELPSQ